jgi:hypothetical protein
MSGERKIVATASNLAEAEVIGEWLSEAGIHSMPQMGSGSIRLGAAAPRGVYVDANEYDRALEVINAEVPSQAELEALSHAIQLTRPMTGEPIEIPVPKRADIEELLSRAAQPTKLDDDEGRGIT